jgi:hypothetical protein
MTFTTKEIKALTLGDANHLNYYYGFNYYVDGPEVDGHLLNRANTWIKTIDASATRFCNFMPDGKVRYLCNYNHGLDKAPFEGVTYRLVEEIQCML